MGFLDKVKDGLEKGKELASDSLEKGQGLAKGQQLKLELKKLEAKLDDAYAAYGRRRSTPPRRARCRPSPRHRGAGDPRREGRGRRPSRPEIAALGEDRRGARSDGRSGRPTAHRTA